MERRQEEHLRRAQQTHDVELAARLGYEDENDVDENEDEDDIAMADRLQRDIYRNWMMTVMKTSKTMMVSLEKMTLL